MPRNIQPVQVNQFAAGFITEFSPLQFPPEASSDEENMEINEDNSRSRRFGINYNLTSTITNTGLTYDSTKILGRNQFKWENAGGDPDKELLVVQIGNYLAIYDLDTEDVNEGLIYSETFSSTLYEKTFGFAVVDGLLVVVNGNKDVLVYEYDGAGTVSKETTNLLIRDLFGVQAIIDSDLTLNDNAYIRPKDYNDEHIYNLRNQGWAIPRLDGNDETVEDPIFAFVDSPDNPFGSFTGNLTIRGPWSALSADEKSKVGLYPSNSDQVSRALFPDANDGDDRNTSRFFAKTLLKERTGSYIAPKGFFIIDALERGASRLEKELAYRTEFGNLRYSVSDLPEDKTPGGATVINEYAGRIWYGGFSGEVVDGDSKSPRMSSFILYSSLVGDKTDIIRCYQEGDPTDVVNPDLLATDGGFIRIDSAYGIKHFESVRQSNFIFAENGVWRVYGIDGEGFRADAYAVDKITDKGCIAPRSVVTVNERIYYWSDDGIYVISRNEFGDWVTNSLTRGRINTFYNNIREEAKRRVVAAYDSFQDRILWVYDNFAVGGTDSLELAFYINKQAFTKNRYQGVTNNLPTIMCPAIGNPYKESTTSEVVTVDGETVTVGGEPVTVTITGRSDSTRELYYVALTSITGSIKFVIAQSDLSTFTDWSSAGGSITEAFLLTGPITGNTNRLEKQVNYVTVSMKKTEDSFNGEFTPLNQSSCLLQSRWDWSDSAASNKWSTAYEVYRPKYLYFPSSPSDEPYAGFPIITTRNKIRGWGRSVRFKFTSSGNKNMHIYGWGFNLAAAAQD